MALNKLRFKGPAQRTVTEHSSGKRYIVQHWDISRDVWTVWAQVDGFTKTYLRVNGVLEFNGSDIVRPRDAYGTALTHALARELFKQFTLEHPGVATGEHLVKTKKGFTSVTANSNWGTPLVGRDCPACNCAMHERKGPQDGFFIGCRNFFKSGCRINVSPTTGRLSDPDRVLSGNFVKNWNEAL